MTDTEWVRVQGWRWRWQWLCIVNKRAGMNVVIDSVLRRTTAISRVRDHSCEKLKSSRWEARPGQVCNNSLLALFSSHPPSKKPFYSAPKSLFNTSNIFLPSTSSPFPSALPSSLSLLSISGSTSFISSSNSRCCSPSSWR